MQRTFCRVGIRQKRIAGKFRVGFGKAGIAGSSFPTLNRPPTCRLLNPGDFHLCQSLTCAAVVATGRTSRNGMRSPTCCSSRLVQCAPGVPRFMSRWTARSSTCSRCRFVIVRYAHPTSAVRNARRRPDVYTGQYLCGSEGTPAMTPAIGHPHRRGQPDQPAIPPQKTLFAVEIHNPLWNASLPPVQSRADF
jgi:hypothetical protein